MIRLIGGSLFVGPHFDFDEFNRFYGTMFERLAAEVAIGFAVTRFVGFEEIVGSTTQRFFLGVEVDSVADIPQGMSAWELSRGSFTEVDSGVVTARPRFEAPIEWQWTSLSPGFFGESTQLYRSCGEFSLPGNGHYFNITANSYHLAGVADPNYDNVEISDYDARWPDDYRRFESELRANLDPKIFVRYEHFGSTSIQGLPAKPIIDVLLGVTSIGAAKRQLFENFNRPDWEYWWYDEHMTFVHRERPMGARIHHLHIAPEGHRVWQAIYFRNYLREHPEVAREYADLKLRLSRAHHTDRERYTSEKGDFVKRITGIARLASSRNRNP